MGRSTIVRSVIAGVVASMLGVAAQAQEAHPPADTLSGAFPKKSYSPHAGRNFPTRPFFGDTHLHTGASMDAGAFGARLGPADAYRFARGEEVTAANGMRVKLARPLDFLVVADHSDNMGFFPKLFAGDPAYPRRPDRQAWYDMIQKGGEAASSVAIEVIDSFSKGTFPPALASLPGTATYRSAWEIDHQGRRDVQRAGPLHRLHRLRVDLEHRRQQPAPRRRLPRRRRQGEPGRALHDASARSAATTRRISGSTSRPTRTRPAARCSRSRTTATSRTASCSRRSTPSPASRITKEYAETRARWEPLYEVTQIKGDGEAHPYPLAERRVRRLRDLGQVQPQPERAEGAGDAAVRVRAHGAADRPAARGEARHESLQVRHDRLDRQPHRPRHRRGGQLLRQAHAAPSRARSAWTHPVGCFGENCIMGWEQAASGYAARLGDARTRARRSSTRWSARRPTPPPARA